MANFAKMTKGAVGHMTKHYERAKDEKGEYVKFGNTEINTEKSHLNYNLAPEHNQLDFIHKRLSEVYCLKRKDVNVMGSWVVTAPKDLHKGLEKAFFEKTYEFLEKTYGKQNVVSAYVHLDEKSPHMHFCFIPVVYDMKKQREKVSAKECVTRYDLQNFHGKLQRHLEQSYIPCTIENEATKEGNKAIKELKRGTAIETLKQTYKEVELVEGHISKLEGEKTALETKISTLEGKILSLEEVNAIQIKKPFLGKERAVIQIPYEDALNLKTTASKVDEIMGIAEESNRKLMTAERLKKEANETLQEAKRIPMKDQMERVHLEKENRELNKLVKTIFEHFPQVAEKVKEVQKAQSMAKTKNFHVR